MVEGVGFVIKVGGGFGFDCKINVFNYLIMLVFFIIDLDLFSVFFV